MQAWRHVTAAHLSIIIAPLCVTKLTHVYIHALLHSLLCVSVLFYFHSGVNDELTTATDSNTTATTGTDSAPEGSGTAVGQPQIVGTKLNAVDDGTSAPTSTSTSTSTSRYGLKRFQSSPQRSSTCST
jgi:hypothetical protein